MKFLLLPLLLLAASLSAADLEGDNLLLEGNVVIAPTNHDGGVALYRIGSMVGTSPEGIKNLIWTWGINIDPRSGLRDDNTLPFAFDSMELRWFPGWPYPGQHWVEMYHTICSPDGTLKFRDSSLMILGTNGFNIERAYRQDSVGFSGVPTAAGYNENPILMLISRMPNGGAFLRTKGFVETQANALNRGGVNIKEGGALVVYSIGDTNSLFIRLSQSSRSGWPGKPVTAIGLNGPPRSLEVKNHTNIYFETARMEVSGEVSASALRLPNGGAPVNNTTPATWIPVAGTNGQTYFIPGYQ